MKPRQVVVVLLLGLTLVVAQVGVTAPAILAKASQLLTLAKTLPNPITLSDMKRSLPDNTYSTYSLPANTAFLLTKASWNFAADDPSYSGDILFTIGNYYRVRLTMSNGLVGNSDNIPLGIPISDFSAKILVCQYGDNTQAPIKGTLSIRLFGYTAPNN